MATLQQATQQTKLAAMASRHRCKSSVMPDWKPLASMLSQRVDLGETVGTPKASKWRLAGKSTSNSYQGDRFRAADEKRRTPRRTQLSKTRRRTDHP
jgi:hypothetical protein